MTHTPLAHCDELDDAALVARFEALDLAPAVFRHREHVRIAFAMLVNADLAEASLRYRRGLLRFVDAAGAGAKYHETLTWAYLVIVQHRIAGEDPDALAAGSLAFLARHPDLLDHTGGALARHYDVARITASPLARRVFVLPERES